ncbi:uncharacterized protein, partial [Macrobrachium rosenbergii]|uniref:uncharacterized protein n=1 Tax=Macrobrachium rosenbergii TaxID=79674 RepID=UPI0034D490B7
LQVKYVQERDAGRYECQISTEPKMSHFVHFHVVTPLVHIPGGHDIYVKSGSTVTLKCIISGALILPEYIFWYQASRLRNPLRFFFFFFFFNRFFFNGGVRDERFLSILLAVCAWCLLSLLRIGTDRVLAEELIGGRQVFVERITDDTTIGTLIITTASPTDQGSYTCVPASLPTASVTLHVLNGQFKIEGVSERRSIIKRCAVVWYFLIRSQVRLSQVRLGQVG